MKKSIQYKGQTLTRTKVINSIIRVYDQTSITQRKDWYQEAHNFAHDLWYDNNNVSVSKICGVIAALSPVKTWEQNKIVARHMLRNLDCGHMELFVDKARRIIESDGTDEAIVDILKGRKITAFYMNIMYPNQSNYVTIDRHALSVAVEKWITDEYYAGMTAIQYQFFVDCYALAAAKRNVSTLTMQSATWTWFRENKKKYRRIK